MSASARMCKANVACRGITIFPTALKRWGAHSSWLLRSHLDNGGLPLGFQLECASFLICSEVFTSKPWTKKGSMLGGLAYMQIKDLTRKTCPTHRCRQAYMKILSRTTSTLSWETLRQQAQAAWAWAGTPHIRPVTVAHLTTKPLAANSWSPMGTGSKTTWIGKPEKHWGTCLSSRM